PVAVTIQHHPTDTGAIGFVSFIAHDISELKHTQAQLEHQATHDALTALPNRALFQELGDQALARSNRYGTTVAVLFLDLDRFKPVNDSLGHAAGDELLMQVASRLRSSVRRGDVVARFGGDEFVVLCEHPAGQSEMQELARRLIDALSQPVPVLATTAQVGASIGIAIGGGGRVTVDTLIRDADAALYLAKEQGRGRAVLFGEQA
ncbi:MAG: GGDEF domain-containing protein, partial [Acidimicrobiia bacterium]